MTALWLLFKPHAMVLGACLAIALGSGWLGYHAGHRACAAPETVKEAHAVTVIAESAQKLIDRPVLVANHALEAALRFQNASLKSQRDTALARLAAAITQNTPLTPADSAAVPPATALAALDTVRSSLRRCDTLAVVCTTFHQTALQKFAADSNVVRAKYHEIVALQEALREARPHRIGLAFDGGYNFTDKQLTGRAEGSLALTGRLSAVGAVSLADSLGALRTRQFVFLRYTIH